MVVQRKLEYFDAAIYIMIRGQADRQADNLDIFKPFTVLAALQSVSQYTTVINLS